MPNLVLFDPSMRDNRGAQSPNLGDVMIRDAVVSEIRQLAPAYKIVRVSTHVPVESEMVPKISACSIGVVGGSNLLGNRWLIWHRLKLFRQWKLSLSAASYAPSTVLLGVGWTQYQGKPDRHNRALLDKLLARNMIHAVRDDYTLEKLKCIGITNVVNTGCPTLWSLAEGTCREECQEKSDVVLTMLTDYSKRPITDRKLLILLKRHYRRVIFWPQGENDLKYVCKLGVKIEPLERTLDALYQFVTNNQCDYIGTRLHGGIYCLLRGVRSLILGIDNRALEMKNSMNLPVLPRRDFEGIQKWIKGPSTSNLRINACAIHQWRSAFRDWCMHMAQSS